MYAKRNGLYLGEMETIFIAGLLLGITSNFHCLGMCGPIAMAIPVDRTSTWSIISGILQYNFGRILTYSLLGALVGTIGITVETLGFLQWISIIAGIFMIVFAWRKWFSRLFSGHLPTVGIQGFISKSLGKVLATQTPFKLPMLGMINGLLPCGMVYIGLMNALLAGDPISSAYAMIAFGVGTIPAMFAVGFAANRISGNVRQKINKVVPFLLTFVGALIVLRGMNLDIPYISPKVKMTTTEKQNELPKLDLSCCKAKTACETKPAKQ